MNKCSVFSGRYRAVICSCEKCSREQCKVTQCSSCAGKVTVGHCAMYGKQGKKV